MASQNKIEVFSSGCVIGQDTIHLMGGLPVQGMTLRFTICRNRKSPIWQNRISSLTIAGRIDG
jgi:hypothetical protein